MRFRLEQARLAEGLRTVGRAVSTKNLIPVLSGIYLAAGGDGLTLRASDLELTVETTVPAEVVEEGAVVLPGRFLSDLVRRLPAGLVEVAVDLRSATALLTCEEAEYAVHGFSAEQFPVEPATGGKPGLEAEAGALRTLLRETSFATGSDESRPWFTGVFLSVEGPRMLAMATDAAVLAFSEIPVHNPEDLRFSVILPGRSVGELTRLLSEESGRCSVVPLQNLFQFRSGAVTVTSRLMEGQYPDFRRLMPAQWRAAVRMERQRLLEACERGGLVARDGAVRLEASAAGLQLAARTPEVGRVCERIPAAVGGEPFEVGLNVRYVLEGLRSMEAPEVVMEYADRNSAVRFRTGSEATGFFAVLPLRSF